MIYLTHTLAFLLRVLGFFGLCGRGLVGLCRREPAPECHTLVFGGLACLFASRILVCEAAELAATAGLLGVLYLVLLVVDVAFAKLARTGANLFLAVAFLLAVGGALYFDTLPAAPVDAGTATKQVVIMIAACAVCLVTLLAMRLIRDANWTRGLCGVLFALAIAVSVLPLTPLGWATYGAGGVVDRARISLAGMSFQPSELARVLVIIAVAGYISQRTKPMAAMELRLGFLPLLGTAATVIALEFVTKDLGSMAVTLLVVVAMLLLCTRSDVPALTAVFLLVAGVLIAAVIWVGFRVSSTFVSRVDVWLSTWRGLFARPVAATQDESNLLYQQLNAITGIVNGGIVGTGLGLGYHLNQIPFVHSDLVVAAVGCELGLVGVLEMLLAYFALVRQTFVTAAHFPRGRFDYNLAVGLGAVVGLQALIILAGSIDLIPLTGVTLPFVSAGGSSMLCLLLLVGFVGGCLSVASEDVPQVETPNVDIHRRPGVLRTAEVLVGACLALCVLRVGGFVWQDGVRLCGATGREITYSVTTSDGVALINRTSDAMSEHSEFPQGSSAAHLLSHYVGMASTSVERLVSTNSATFREAATRGFVSNPLGYLRNLLAIPETIPDVVLTLNAEVQTEAERQLAGTYGAIVAIDVHTGQVLAMASSPTATPDELEDIYKEVAQRHDEADKEAQKEGKEHADSYPYDPESEKLVNRAIGITYPPGSTFKVVTTASALANGVAGQGSVCDGDNLTLAGGAVVYNHNRENFGNITLRQALAVSSNSVFAQVGLELGSQRLAATAGLFGFTGVSPTSFPGAIASTFGEPGSDYALAWAAAGQPDADGTGGGPRATVLEMATVAATVANGGLRVEPYLIEPSSSLTADSLATYDGHRYVGSAGTTQAMGSSDASTLWSMMRDAASSASSSYGVSTQGLVVAGKTGSAQRGEGTCCWYIGATEDVAVACCIEAEADDLGGAVAQPRALDVLATAASVRS